MQDQRTGAASEGGASITRLPRARDEHNPRGLGVTHCDWCGAQSDDLNEEGHCPGCSDRFEWYREGLGEAASYTLRAAVAVARLELSDEAIWELVEDELDQSDVQIDGLR
jgi:hypothetical protein